MLNILWIISMNDLSKPYYDDVYKSIHFLCCAAVNECLLILKKTIFIENVFYVVNCFLSCANITETVTLTLKYNFNCETQ